MSSLLIISTMLRELWQTILSNNLTCYGSLEGSEMRSSINVIMQQIVHVEKVSGRQYIVINLLVMGCRRGVGWGVL